MVPTNDNQRVSESQSPADSNNDDGATALLRAQTVRLEERVKKLEEERERNLQTIAALQEDRDAYRRAVYAWALQQITDEDLKRYVQDEEGLPLDDFIRELEQGARLSRDA